MTSFQAARSLDGWLLSEGVTPRKVRHENSHLQLRGGIPVGVCFAPTERFKQVSPVSLENPSKTRGSGFEGRIA
jgi:hypothetical protein